MSLRFRFTVCSRSSVKRAAKRIEATHLLTMLDPGRTVFRPPRIAPANHLRLSFLDEDRDGFPFCPEKHHVERILKWGRDLPDGASVVVHCEAGVCRSSAAAFLLVAQELGVDRAQKAIDLVVAERPVAMPNMLMVRLGDELLCASGRLVEVAEAQCQKRVRELLA
jgi:predicted protein tyrosine phosphatase